MSLIKNAAGQKLYVLALDDAGDRFAGDAANITCTAIADHGAATALGDQNPTDLGQGVYAFDLTQAETDHNHLVFLPVSATAGVTIAVHAGENGPTIHPNLSPTVVLATGGNVAQAVDDIDSIVETAVTGLAIQGAVDSIQATATAIQTTVDAIPAAADNATAVDAAMAPRFGALATSSQATAIQTAVDAIPAAADSAATVDAIQAALAQLNVAIDALPEATQPLSPEAVADVYTWRVTGGHQTLKTIAVNQGHAGSFAVDYADALVGAFDEDIAPTVVVSGATSVTEDSVAYSTSMRQIIVKLPALTTLGTYTVAVVGTTVDGQTIPVDCTLRVQ